MWPPYFLILNTQEPELTSSIHKSSFRTIYPKLAFGHSLPWSRNKTPEDTGGPSIQTWTCHCPLPQFVCTEPRPSISILLGRGLGVVLSPTKWTLLEILSKVWGEFGSVPHYVLLKEKDRDPVVRHRRLLFKNAAYLNRKHAPADSKGWEMHTCAPVLLESGFELPLSKLCLLPFSRNTFQTSLFKNRKKIGNFKKGNQ